MSVECHLTAVEPKFVQDLLADPVPESCLRHLAMQKTVCNLDKAWHALHFLLTGSAEEGTGPQSYLMNGGRLLGEPEEEEPEAPPRLLLPEEVKAFDAVLQPLDDEELLRRFDHAAMLEAGLYGIGVHAQDELEFVSRYLKLLRSFVAQAASAGHGVVVTIG